MGIAGLFMVFTGWSPAQAATVQTRAETTAVVQRPAASETPAQRLKLAKLHAWHLTHLAHLAHVKAMLAQELAIKEQQHAVTLQQDAAVPQNVLRYQGSTAMQQCIISAESGGNPQIWNASGHWGLYQFNYGTWTAHGGPAADFGHAGASEQTAVFWQTVKDDGGYGDWTPYDGC